MRFVPLIWMNVWRRKIRTTFTLLSIFIAFLLFGLVMTIRAAFGFGVDIAGQDRIVLINKITLILPLPISYQRQIQATPGPGAGQRTAGGYPTREAAIAEIERQVAERAQAEGPAQMQSAAATLQGEIRTNVTAAQQQADASAQAQVQQGQARAQELRAQQPPVTGAQVAAQVQPQYAAHQQEATLASAQMRAEIMT